MYRVRLPRTKLTSPVPAARFDGRLAIDGRDLSLEGWHGLVGHNWGAEHAERWVWLYGLTPGGDWLDVAAGRVALGPITTPWIASGAVSLAGRRHAVGGPGRRTRIGAAPGRCDFRLRGRGLTVSGRVSAPLEDFVGWVYADPGGGEHHSLNCSIATMTLSIEPDGGPPRELEIAGAAYELGLREHDHGVPIQPFPDG
jgi:hypothetical protein